MGIMLSILIFGVLSMIPMNSPQQAEIPMEKPAISTTKTILEKIRISLFRYLPDLDRMFRIFFAVAV